MNRESTERSERPLDGVRIVEITTYVSGPMAGLALADLGADVIKIERVDGGDDGRHTPPMLDGEGLFFAESNRAKRSVAVDLKSPQGIAIVRDLVARADVVLDNFRPGVMARLGLDYEALRAINPRIIACSVTGFGDHSTADERVAYDPVLQAMSGLMLSIGLEGGPPIRVRPSIVDRTAGLWAANGILAALYARERTGRGEQLSVSLLGAVVNIMAQEIVRYYATGDDPVRTGSAGPGGGPQAAFLAGDGNWVQVTCGNDRIWRRLCQAVGRAELADDPRFVGQRERFANTAALNQEFEAIMVERSRDEWVAILEQADVPSGPVNTVSEFVADDGVREGFVWQARRTATGNEVPQVRLPVVFGASATLPPGAPPALGEHTDAVLAGELGYSKAQISALRAKGVVA